MKTYHFLKNLFVLMVAFMTTTALAACGGDDDNGAGGGTPVAGLTVKPQTLSFSADGGTLTISAQAPQKAEATSSADWCQVTVGDQQGDLRVTPITVVAAANPTTYERTAVVTITAGSLSATVMVTQAEGTADIQPGNITKTAMQIAREMYPGWNLGNTMEAGSNANNWTNNGGTGAETAWQQTRTTQAIIDYVRSQGFRSVRIPTAWVMGHITDAGQATIDPAWMARVKEVVDYCVSAGLYVLLNDHWDGGWLENSFGDTSEATIAANSEKLAMLWTQIAHTFAHYDEHVIFGGLNEPSVDNERQTEALLKYEQAFINAVRATGGNNGRRTLVVQGPSTDVEKTSKWYDITRLSDPAGSGYLMAEVHYYTPPQFTGVWENNQPVWFWGAANHVSGDSHNASWGEEQTVQQMFQLMKSQFADQGYPVILGEYGANWRKLSANQDKHDASIRLYHKTVCQRAVECGMVPMVWDVNVANQNGEAGIMTVINRANTSVYCSFAMDGITEGVAAAQWPY